MAEFLKAYNAVIKGYEGKYANNPNDRGKETYKGVSRRAHPHWRGWKNIDGLKGSIHFPAILEDDADLQKMVLEFYEENYWNRINGNEIPLQDVAEEILDMAVHAGVEKAVEHLQRALNLLNRKEKYYKNLLVDGLLGTNTMQTLMRCIYSGQSRRLFNVLNLYQGKFYIEIMEHSEDQEEFIGWFERVKLKGVTA